MQWEKELFTNFYGDLPLNPIVKGAEDSGLEFRQF